MMTTQKLEGENLNYGSGWPLPRLEIQNNHEGTPCVYFNNFDSHEVHDGFTVSEMCSIVAAINKAMRAQNELVTHNNQMTLEFGE